MSTETVEDLTTKLRSSAWTERRDAARDLGEELQECLEDMMTAIQEQAALPCRAYVFDNGASYERRGDEVNDAVLAAVACLQTALQDDSSEVRRASAGALGKIGIAATPALKMLARVMLSDGDPKVRTEAAAAFQALGKAATPVIPELTTALSDDVCDVRAHAAGALRGIGEAAASAVPELTKVLLSGGWATKNAATALARMGKAAAPAVPSLAQLLSCQEADVSEVVVKVLGQLSTTVPAALEVLGDALMRRSHYPTVVRLRAAENVGTLGAQGAPHIDKLVSLLSDTEDVVRSKAAEALGKIGPDALVAMPTLKAIMIADKEADVRRESVTALGKVCAGADIVHNLEQVFMTDPDFGVRSAAVRLLGSLGQSAAPAVNALGELLLKDRSSFVRQTVITTLGQLNVTAAAAVPSLAKVLEDETQVPICTGAAAVLGSLGARAAAAVPQLARATLESPNGEVREAALQALLRMGNVATPAVEIFGAALVLGDWQHKARCATALGRLGKRASSAVPQLKEMCSSLGSEDPCEDIAKCSASTAIRNITGDTPDLPLSMP